MLPYFYRQTEQLNNYFALIIPARTHLELGKMPGIFTAKFTATESQSRKNQKEEINRRHGGTRKKQLEAVVATRSSLRESRRGQSEFSHVLFTRAFHTYQESYPPEVLFARNLPSKSNRMRIRPEICH
jgi:hypothetical protein